MATHNLDSEIERLIAEGFGESYRYFVQLPEGTTHVCWTDSRGVRTVRMKQIEQFDGSLKYPTRFEVTDIMRDRISITVTSNIELHHAE